MCHFLVFGQTEKKVHFSGYNLVQYKGPVWVSDGVYKASFQNLGEQRIRGRIIIDESKKTFIIKWINGDDWICKYYKIETEEVHENWYGNVTKTMYQGKWIDDNNDAMLIITKTKSNGCITSLKSRKVTDKEYGIDVWKNSLTFGTGGECIK